MLKKIGVFALICWLTALESLACDLCSTYLTLNPGDFRNSFGITNRLRTFESSFNYEIPQYYSPNAKLSHVSLEPGSERTSTSTYKETFVSYDIWGRYFFNPRLQVAVSTTFTDNYHHENDTLTNSIAGIGDIQTIALYRLVNSKYSTDTNRISHRLTVGGGFKLPTGSFNKVGMEEELDPHMQPGTGSLDYLLIAEYLVRYHRFGMSFNFLFRHNSENRNGFRFADRKNYNLSLFYLSNGQKVKWMPNIGMSFEAAKRDRINDDQFPGSGGEAGFVNIGMRVFAGSFSFSANYYPQPFHEDLYDQSIQLNNKERLITEITYFFK